MKETGNYTDREKLIETERPIERERRGGADTERQIQRVIETGVKRDKD